jgi:hypothetical protein
MTISKEGKKELALAIFLWKEFKSQGKQDLVIHKQMFKLAKYTGVVDELNGVIKTCLWPIEVRIKE